MKWWHWLGLGFLVCLVWVDIQIPDKNLHVVFCDVGQGDASLIIKGDFQMVIDGGPRGERLLACLGNHLPFWDRRIEMVINTHPQKDHLGGLDDLLRTYKVDNMVINGVFGGGRDGERLRELLSEKRAKIILPKEGDVFRVGGLQFDVLWPRERMGNKLAWTDPTRIDLVGEVVLGKNTDVNVMSVVGILKWKGFDVIFTGDLGKKQEEKILEEGRLKQVEVLKVAHHGSKYSSSRAFLQAVRPEVAVISVGKKNNFGHPTKETLKRLKMVGARIFRTDLNGEVEIVSDGERYWLKKRGWL